MNKFVRRHYHLHHVHRRHPFGAGAGAGMTGGSRRKRETTDRDHLRQGQEDLSLFSALPKVGQLQGRVEVGEVVVAVAVGMVGMAPTRTTKAAQAIMIISRRVLDVGRLGGRMRPEGDCNLS